MTANELAILLFKRWNGDDVEIPPNLDDLCSEMLQKQQAKIEALQEHNVNLVDDLFSERKEVIRLEAEIEQLKALAISLSHRNANIQYTRSEK
jgi:predicted RNase H-like nuclease (RuvC/YqgF family)